MAAVIYNLLAAVIISWGYQPVGSFADPGPCHSAARIGEVFILGCRLGVWHGRSGELRLVIPCTVRDDRPNRVVSQGGNKFMASTACGLFQVDQSGSIERIPFFTRPGALDADDSGRAVVENRGEVWLLDASLGSSLVANLGDEVPFRLQLAGDYLLIEGDRRRVQNLKSGARFELPGWGKMAVFGPGRRLLVHPSGRYWNVAIGSPLDQARRLPLGHGERVSRVVGLGARALVLTTRRMIVIQGRDLEDGRLPPVAGRPVPVGGSRSAEPPWMVVGSDLFRPVPDQAIQNQHRLGGLLPAAVARQGLWLPEYRACSSGWLPRLDISVFGGQSRSLAQAAENRWSYARARTFGIMFGLSWSLDRTMLCQADSQRFQLLRAIRKERRELEDRLAGLLDVLRQHCRGKDRSKVDQIRALLEVLTGQEVTCRLE